MFELTASCAIRWLIRIALIYAVVRYARSQRSRDTKDEQCQGEQQVEVPNHVAQQDGLRQRRQNNGASVDDIIEKLSKPRTLWEANKPQAVSLNPKVALPKAPGPKEAAKIAKPKRERDRREENLQVLRHHSRPVTWVCFNKEGNLLFSCGKDALVVAWTYQDGWQILAVYSAHTGAVWCCSISDDSTLLCTCGADNKVIVWSAREMQREAVLDVNGVAKFCEWRRNKIKECMPTFAICHNNFGKSSPARIVVCEYHPQEIKVLYAIGPESNATQVRWTSDELLVSAHECGKVVFWRMAEKLFEIDHREKLSKIALHDNTLACALLSGELKVYTFGDKDATPILSVKTDRPLNDVSFEGDTFAVGGGQDARDVALVSNRVEKQFTPLVYTASPDGLAPKYENNFRNHFGPIHCLAFTDHYLASGSEDGLVHVEALR